jgi:ATP-binding cassette, subfamily B, bacterial PglK
MNLPGFLDAVRPIFAQLPPERKRQFWSIAVFSILVGLLEIGVAGAVSLLGVAIASPESLLKLRPVRYFLDQGFSLVPSATDPGHMMAAMLGIVVVLVMGKNVLMGLLTWTSNRFSFRVAADVGVRLFASFLSQPYVWHLSHNSADLQVLLTWRFQIALYTINLMVVIAQLTSGAFLLGGSILLVPGAALMVFCVTGLSAYLVYRWSRRRVDRYAQELSVVDSDIMGTSLPALQGVRELLIFRRQRFFQERYARLVGTYGDLHALLLVFPPLPSWVLESVGMLTLLLALFCLMAMHVGAAGLTGTLTLLAAVAWRLLPAMNRAVGGVVQMRNVLPLVNKVLEQCKEVPQGPELTAEAVPFTRELALADVSFRYPQSEEDALWKVSLSVRKGSMVGIIGRSGAGKSTLVGILTGLMTPDSGCVTVDDVPLDQFRRAGWGMQVGYVPQAPFLLDASLADNVALSSWGESIDRDRVSTCCDMAAIDFLDQLPEGLDTLLGERGTRLSGGQLQRVAIARALYSGPSCIIFDEATSSLDAAAEAAIQRTINGLRDQMTLIVIAHRLSTVEMCDTVCWLQGGKVVDSGPPEVILPAYRQALQATCEEMTE